MAESLLRFSCYSCKKIPTGSTFICDNRHLYCNSCAQEIQNICRCKKNLVSKRNPLLNELVKNGSNCKFKQHGCTWVLKAGSNHESECKFRNDLCIGIKLEVFRCQWKGRVNDLYQHLKIQHTKEVVFYKHADGGTLLFHENKLKPCLGCIDAHANTFILYYMPMKEKQMVNILVIMCGTKITAGKFVYEFEINSMKNSNLKIKFNLECISDSEDINAVISSGKCASIGFHVIKRFLNGNKIHFRLRILKPKATE